MFYQNNKKLFINLLNIPLNNDAENEANSTRQ